MGYRTTLHLIDVKIEEESLPIVKKALQTRKGRGLRPLVHFLDEAFLADDEFLCFKSTGRHYSPYFPDDEDGTVPELVGGPARSAAASFVSENAGGAGQSGAVARE